LKKIIWRLHNPQGGIISLLNPSEESLPETLLMLQDVGTIVLLMAVLKPWTNWKRHFSKDRVSKKTPTCC
jgi:hypothetical protein